MRAKLTRTRMTQARTRRAVHVSGGAAALGAGLLAAALLGATPGSAVGSAVQAASTSDGADAQATLVARAILPADASSPGPWTAAANLQPDLTSPGGEQPVGGFSALVRDRHGDLWAMPDNGFGTKANSPSFILRMYRVD